MKKFLSGVLCATLVFSLAISALAISGNVSFNLSAIKFDGVVISEAGEGYTLSNGCVAPASITYTDEQGGGTTYLPVRRIGELAGVTIDWDGAVVVKTPEFVEQEERDAERAAALDYSDWSAEDEAAYQEFKGMWEDIGTTENPKLIADIDAVKAYAAKTPKDKAYSYIKRMSEEYLALSNGFVGVSFWDKDNSDDTTGALLGVTNDGNTVKLGFDMIWDDFKFRIGFPMNVEL